MRHQAVLPSEVPGLLGLKAGLSVVDATFGGGGHAAQILERIGPMGRLIALDQDPEAIARGKKRFHEYANISFHQENFRNIEVVLKRLNLQSIDAVILDVGFSSDQLEDSGRGFSFEGTEPLDMRMNPSQVLQAKDLINDLSQENLEKIFRVYGEERFSGRIARVICEERIKKPVTTTEELVRLIFKAIPGGQRKGPRTRTSKLHPATRVFQALRITVNDELDALREALPRFFEHLNSKGRIGVISFHSLEDRIVKNYFRELKMNHLANIITKKPIVPTREEMLSNPRSRSAKFRVAEKI